MNVLIRRRRSKKGSPFALAKRFNRQTIHRFSNERVCCYSKGELKILG